MKGLINKFQQLSEREQRLVLISTVLVVVAVFYWGIWAPINNGLSKERTAIQKQQSLLLWVQKNANRAVQLRGAGGQKTTFNGSLPQAVNQTASRLGIPIARMQPQGEELLIWVDNAPFNDVLSWLQAIEQRGIRILDLDVTSADQAGYIKVRRLQLGKS